ncbi:hypothetical protein [Aequorivita antarctica]|uniref:Lipocalin-like domain-containing protein n=1 Tax=Aequorivita antarctica TaxID=153266 RepID=A0A5C6Z1D9_9FLAO|nr:hypothetical protein [Aequorivita antarctica]TXD73266.1 hypothetical protein ESU54_09005 [Aequorivita antarctica]SRX76019.1 hypothetical protein AEQU3_03017 [Aequorivita antarctica]
MKTTLSILLLLAIISNSCNKNNDDDSNIPSPSLLAENNWLLGDYVYARSSSAQENGSYVNGSPFTLINIESDIASVNDSFIASNLQVSFNTSTIGNYTIKSETTTVVADELKYLDIQCTIMDATGKTALYKSQDTTTLAQVREMDGKFVVNIPELITLTLASNNGLPDPPESFLFMCNKVR